MSAISTHPMRRWHAVIAVAIILLDRLTKWIVGREIALHDTVDVIPSFFRLTHVRNSGAAFGMFSESPSEWKVVLLVMFSVIALVVVSALLWKNSYSLTATGIGLSLILGGAIGNLWDRLLAGHVVDFLEFYLGPYHWPAFNVADSAIVIGALLLVSEILVAKHPQHENLA